MGENGMDLTGIDYLGIARVLQRGTGDVIERRDRALLVYDRVSGLYMLGCEDAAQGWDILRRSLPGCCRLLMVTDRGLGLAAFRGYGFTGILECYQAAYYGGMPKLTGRLAMRDAREVDLPLLTAVYDLESEESLRRIVAQGKLTLGYADGRLAGFMGEHLEGSMGLLYVFPEFRRRGYAEELEKARIAKTLREGLVPVAQIEKNNLASMALQRKLGLTVSAKLACWMWK